MSVVVRAVYHEHDFNSVSITYIIGIYIKSSARQSAADVDFEPLVNVVYDVSPCIKAANRHAVLRRHASF